MFSTHPRTLSKIKKINKGLIQNIIFSKPFGYFDYINLQMNAKVTISDSGSIVEESNILNFPAVNLRETTERQEGMEQGCCIITGLSPSSITSSVEIVLKKFSLDRKANICNDYLHLNVSDKIITIIQSYIPYINRKVWFK